MSRFNVGKKYKNCNRKFNKKTNVKNEQVKEKEVQRHLDFLVAVGLMEEKNGLYKEPEICNSFSETQRKFVMNVCKKSYEFALSEDNEVEIPQEAVKGMISAIEDVKKGNYNVLTKGDALSEKSEVKHGN